MIRKKSVSSLVDCYGFHMGPSKRNDIREVGMSRHFGRKTKMLVNGLAVEL